MLSLAVRRVQADAGSTSTRPGNGEDLRPRPLSERKAKLARLLARARAGIALNGHTEEDGAVVFRHACMMGLEGAVSKRLGRALDQPDHLVVVVGDLLCFRFELPGALVLLPKALQCCVTTPIRLTTCNHICRKSVGYHRQLANYARSARR
jgi:hypothetical protein